MAQKHIISLFSSSALSSFIKPLHYSEQSNEEIVTAILFQMYSASAGYPLKAQRGGEYIYMWKKLQTELIELSKESSLQCTFTFLSAHDNFSSE